MKALLVLSKLETTDSPDKGHAADAVADDTLGSKTRLAMGQPGIGVCNSHLCECIALLVAVASDLIGAIIDTQRHELFSSPESQMKDQRGCSPSQKR